MKGSVERLRVRVSVGMVIAAYVLLAAGFGVVMPLGEAPDEVSHYAYVRYLALNRALPGPEGAASGESFQPPLYYVLGAALTAWVPEGGFTIKANSDYSLAVVRSVPNVLLHTSQEDFPYRDGALAWHLVRLLSVAMGAVTVWATYSLARVVFPGREQLALAAAAFNAFIPEFLFISGAINNDNLVAMLSGLTLLQMARLWHEGQPEGERGNSRGWLCLGVLLGLGFWAKLSMLLFWPLAALVVLAGAWVRRDWSGRAWRAAAGKGVLVFVPAALMGAPLAVRNVLTYGDPLGWRLMRAVTEAVAGPLSLADYADWLGQLFQSFWGRFGGAAHVLLPMAVYAGLGVVCSAAVAGDFRLMWARRRTAMRPVTDPLIVLLGLVCLIVAVLLWQWAHTNQGTGQARLAYPALSAISIFFVAGLAAWRGGAGSTGAAGAPRAGGLPGVTTAAMLVLSVWVLAGYLLPLYHLPPRITLDEVPLAARRGPFSFGNDIRLVGWEMEQKVLRPGDTTYVTLYWQAVGVPGEDYWLLLRLQGDADRLAWDKDGTPSAGRDSTDTWRAGEVMAARHRIALPEQAPAGGYRLLAGVHRFGQWEWLTIRDAQGNALGDTIALESVQVAAR